MRRTLGVPIHLTILLGLLGSAFSGIPLRAGAPAGPSPPARGDEPAPVVTEEEFLSGFDGAHPARVALTGELGEARADRVEAATLPDPELSVAREGPTDDTEQIDLTLSWQPPRPDRRRLAVEVAQAEIAAAGARLEGRRLDLRLELRAVYARWALAHERRVTLERHADRIASLAGRERLRAERGEASGLSARRLELVAERTRNDSARAAAAHERARATARAWRPDLPAGVEPDLPELPDTGPDPSAIAVPSHPRMASLEAEVEASRLEAHLAERVVRVPELMAGWQRIDQGDRTYDGPLLGLSWTIPLFDRNRAERLRAETRLTATRARLEQTHRDLAAELAGARAAYGTLRASALALRRTASRTAPMVRAATAAFRMGEADLTDLLDTLRSVTETELDALELIGEALASHRELERAAGRPLASKRNETAPSEPNPEGDDR